MHIAYAHNSVLTQCTIRVGVATRLLLCNLKPIHQLTGEQFMYEYTGNTSFMSPLQWGDLKTYPDSKVHGANMGPTWVLSAPDGPHVGPMSLAIRVWIVYRTIWHRIRIEDAFSRLQCHGPLTRYVKLRVAHAPGMSGTISPPPTSKETNR